MYILTTYTKIFDIPSSYRQLIRMLFIVVRARANSILEGIPMYSGVGEENEINSIRRTKEGRYLEIF